jgi:hypothetical protein
LIELALLDRGNRDHSVYLKGNKKAKMDEDAQAAESETQDMLDAVEKLVVDALPSQFKCFCGLSLTNNNRHYFGASLKAHFCSYCLFFDGWRHVLLRMQIADGRKIFEILKYFLFSYLVCLMKLMNVAHLANGRVTKKSLFTMIIYTNQFL